MRFFQSKQLAVYLIAQAIKAVIATIDDNLYVITFGTVAEHISIAQGRHVVPHIEGHTVAHTQKVDGHGVEHPLVVGTYAQHRGISLGASFIEQAKGVTLFGKTAGRTSSIFYLAGSCKDTLSIRALPTVDEGECAFGLIVKPS